MALDVRWPISWLKRHMLTYISLAFIANCCVQQQSAWTTASFLCVTMIVGAASHPIRSSFDFFSPRGAKSRCWEPISPLFLLFLYICTVLKYNQAPDLLCGCSWGYGNTISACQQYRPIKALKISASAWNDEMRWCEPFFVQWTLWQI